MRVYTYFDQCCQTALVSKTLELWRISWTRNGWDPVVLTENDAKSHPLYESFSGRVRSFPSANGLGFDYHCFMRWLALANLSGTDGLILTTEPDVINYELTPDSFAIQMSVIGAMPGVLHFFSPVPAFVVGLLEQFNGFCSAVTRHEMNDKDNYEGRPHLSDQDFAWRYGPSLGLLKFITPNFLCSEAFHDSWKTSPAVHYGTPYMSARGLLPKDEHIPNLR